MFNQVVGQQKIKERLIRSVQEGRIPHAQLFHGREGVGKLPLAIAYAQYICCTDRQENDACGRCPSCAKFNILSHPDLHLVFPVIKPAGKTNVVSDYFVTEFRELFSEKRYFSLNDWYEKIGGGSKSGMIYVSESSSILKKLNLKTYESKYKIMIIWLPELMHEALANKILKIIEEPTPSTLFLLVSNHSERIIKTILSRTQQIKIPPLSKEEISEALREKYLDADISRVEDIANISQGSFVDAENLLLQEEETNFYFNLFVELMRQAWLVGNKKDYDALKKLRIWSEDLSTKVGREQQKQFLSYAQKMIRENFIFNLKQKELNYMNEYEKAFSDNFSPFVNEMNIEALLNEFGLAERHIEQNTSPKMVFFDLALKTIMNIKK